ncbi:hypothetical protein BH11PLA2_BH11PLA2_49990 [soil metagenome]
MPNSADRDADAVRLELSQLPADTPLSVVFARTCVLSAQVLQISRVGIWLFVEHNTALRCVNLYELGKDEHSAGALLHVADYPNYFQAPEVRRSVPAEVAVADPRTAELADSYMRPLGITSMLDAGLFVDGALVGVICHEHIGLPLKFSTEARDFASSMADLVALRIQTAKLNELKSAFRTQQHRLLAGEKAEALSQMAAGVAHDFSNLLTIVGGHAELLDSLERMPSEAKALLKPILEASQRGRALVRELIAFARPEKGEAPTVVDLVPALQDFLPMIRSALGHTHRIEYVRGTSRALVLMNKTQFCRIAFNLAINARDAMPDGGTITLRMASVQLKDKHEQRHHYVLLEVSDTGTGMDPQTLKRIGEPYFTTKPTGTGLGVAIVRKNVDRAGGILRIESTPGEGSTFRVFLPRVGSATGDTQEFEIPEDL